MSVSPPGCFRQKSLPVTSQMLPALHEPVPRTSFATPRTVLRMPYAIQRSLVPVKMHHRCSNIA